MIDNPLVSIVVITYNQKLFIGECINSILQQDYDNIEIIIADDCSTDGTRQIAEQFLNNYPDKIKLALASVNGGITKNSNNGLKLVTGELLCVTGGDDIFLPGKLSKQVQWFIDNSDGATCTTDIEVFMSETNKTTHIVTNKEYKKGGPAKAIIEQRNQSPSSNFMLNRTLCPDLMFDERTPVVSDWLFHLETALLGKIGYIDGVYLRYRRHENNATSGGAAKGYLVDRLIYVDILQSKYPQYYKSCNIQRANILFESAKREFFDKNYKVARLKTLAGIAAYKFDLRNWALLISTFFGRYLHQYFIRIRKKP